MAALVKKLKSVMEKRCDQAETVIAFEVAAAAHYLVDRMTLNDPFCKAVRNRTHWVLKTQRYQLSMIISTLHILHVYERFETLYDCIICVLHVRPLISHLLLPFSVRVAAQ